MKTARVVAASFLALASVMLAASHPAQARERAYYVAAEEIAWNYAPAGRDLLFDKPLPKLAPAQLGWTYEKLVYRGFTDATFSHRTPMAAQDAYLGLLGPVIHAAVGDTVVVTFKNATHVRVGFEPVGGLIGQASGPIAPGTSQVYRYRVPDSAGPGPMDISSTLWTYRSGNAYLTPTDDAGLFGPIVVTRRGGTKPDGTPADVDRELFAVFSISEEARSPVFRDALADPRLNPRKIDGTAQTISDDNSFVSINGYTFGDLPTIVLRRDERVRWYLFATSNTFDFHNPVWNGESVLVAGHRADTADMTPSATSIADMVPDEPGMWMLWDAQNAFMAIGAYARFEVRP